jgi:starch-binding outer membrane protein, SusD/RagB family
VTTYPLQDTTAVFTPFPHATSKTYTLKYVAPINQGSPANWKVIRYADVLLMLAEAMNENGKTAQAHSVLNQVRQRAGVPAHDGLTQAQFGDAIEMERRLELAFEGHRWFDLVRWGRAHQRLRHRGMLPHRVLFPLPNQQVERINNPAIFPQNPGYE